jgi:uncharacterized MAPEG superfamily protein
MTTPFWCLFLVALLPYVLSTTTGALRVRQFGTLDNKYPRKQALALEGLGARVNAAQANAWEALAFFASAVLVAHLAGADPESAARASVGFAITRVLHPICYAANWDWLRSGVFLVGLACGFWLFALAIRG